MQQRGCGEALLTIWNVCQESPSGFSGGALDDLEAQRLLGGRRSQRVLVVGDPLARGRGEDVVATAAFGAAEPQSAQLLVELVGIDAIVGRVASGRARRGRATAGGGGRVHSVETDGFVVKRAMV